MCPLLLNLNMTASSKLRCDNSYILTQNLNNQKNLLKKTKKRQDRYLVKSTEKEVNRCNRLRQTLLTLSFTGRPKGSGLIVTVPLSASSKIVAEIVVFIGTPNLLQQIPPRVRAQIINAQIESKPAEVSSFKK